MALNKIRDASLPVAQFNMPLSEALALLIPPNERGNPNETWHLQVVGNTLFLTRERAEIPNGAQGQGALNR